jgi:NTP pyrophosphatase (non-canonical NTP hydrolase)
LSKTTEGLAEELGEFTKARRYKNQPEMIDALGDLMVWCLGGMEILGVDSEHIIEEIVKNNASRTYGENHY